MIDLDSKQQVQQFYDEVGWQIIADGIYQNARYEDLRPVSSDYIHRCHLRVNHFLSPAGGFLLDAGSGPVQYPEYLTYSQGYQNRVCLDISIVALQEARKRLGDHGLFVVADVANLPFKENTFDGIVSLHTLHHLSYDDQKKGYFDLYRVLKPGKTAVIVNGWSNAPLMRLAKPLVVVLEKISAWVERQRTGKVPEPAAKVKKTARETGTGTYIRKMTPDLLHKELGGTMDFEIRVWRSVNVRFLRAVIQPWLFGKFWLKLLYALEERFPHYFGTKGQYPMIVIHKQIVNN